MRGKLCWWCVRTTNIASLVFHGHYGAETDMNDRLTADAKNQIMKRIETLMTPIVDDDVATPALGIGPSAVVFDADNPKSES